MSMTSIQPTQHGVLIQQFGGREPVRTPFFAAPLNPASGTYVPAGPSRDDALRRALDVTDARGIPMGVLQAADGAGYVIAALSVDGETRHWLNVGAGDPVEVDFEAVRSTPQLVATTHTDGTYLYVTDLDGAPSRS